SPRRGCVAKRPARDVVALGGDWGGGGRRGCLESLRVDDLGPAPDEGTDSLVRRRARVVYRKDPGRDDLLDVLFTHIRRCREDEHLLRLVALVADQGELGALHRKAE